MTTTTHADPFASPDEVDPFAQPMTSEEPEDFIRNGRYSVPDPEGSAKLKQFTRVTNWAKHISDSYRLSLWQQRMVAKGICMDDGLRAEVSNLDVTDDRAVFDKKVEEAKKRADNKGRASLGSAVHRFTERLDEGSMTLDEVPSTWRPDVARYAEEMDRLGLKIAHEPIPTDGDEVKAGPLMSEVTVYEPTHKVMGTLDRVVRVTRRLEVRKRDGSVVVLEPGDLVIFDLKTGARALEFGGQEHAIQFACYANATLIFDKKTATYRPMPEGIRTDIGLVFHLPIGEPEKASVAGVDIAAGWAAAFLVREVKNWQNRSDLLMPLALADTL